MNYATYDHALDTLDEVIEEIEMRKSDEDRAAYIVRELDSIPGRVYREAFVEQQLKLIRYEERQAVLKDQDAARTTPAAKEEGK